MKIKTFAICFLSACAAENASNQQPTPYQSAAPATGSTHISVDRSISEQCGTTAARAQFEFDASQVSTRDHNLDRLADCLSSGNLKDRNVRVVGYTDPRGSDDYNKALGQSRAETVASYLSSHGVKSDKIITKSRGKDVEVGKDNEGYAFDRRVEIGLAD